MRLQIALALVAVSVGGCATPYQELGFTGGVRATRLDETTVQVQAHGNGFTNPDTVAQYVIRKAAEETVADGYDLFLIVSEQDRTKTGTVTMPGYATTNTYGSANVYGNSIYGSATSNTTYTPPTRFNYSKPGETATIKMFKGTKPAGAPPNLYDAHEVLRYMVPPKR